MGVWSKKDHIYKKQPTLCQQHRQCSPHGRASGEVASTNDDSLKFPSGDYCDDYCGASSDVASALTASLHPFGDYDCSSHDIRLLLNFQMIFLILD